VFRTWSVLPVVMWIHQWGCPSTLPPSYTTPSHSSVRPSVLFVYGTNDGCGECHNNLVVGLCGPYWISCGVRCVCDDDDDDDYRTNLPIIRVFRGGEEARGKQRGWMISMRS